MKNPPYLLRGDHLLLAIFGCALCAIVTVTDPPLGDAGVIQLRSVREMGVSQQWLIPTVGGAPQLDRTPVAQWLLLSSQWCGWTIPTAARVFSSIAFAFLGWLVASVGARVFGRAVGLLAAFMTFSTLAFLRDLGDAGMNLIPGMCSAVAMLFWMSYEATDQESDESSHRWPRSLIAPRCRRITFFFLTLTLAALTQGLIAFCLSILLPLAFYVATSKQVGLWRSFAWIWGWLFVFAAGSVWPLMVWWQFPDVSAIWLPTSFADWLEHIGPDQIKLRALAGSMQILKLASIWIIALPLGYWWTRHDALGTRRSAERWLWTISVIGPVGIIAAIDRPRTLLFSFAVLWNLLAAVGIERTLSAVFHILRDWLQAKRSLIPVRALPITRQSLSIAFGCFVFGMSMLIWRDSMGINTTSSMRLLSQFVRREETDDDIVIVDMELGNESAVALWELDGRAWPVHNLSFLLDDRLPTCDLLVVTRKQAREPLELLGEVTDVVEVMGDKSLSAYRVRLHPELAKFSSKSVNMTLAQATHREAGPWPTGRCISSAYPLSVPNSDQTMIAADPSEKPGETQRR